MKKTKGEKRSEIDKKIFLKKRKTNTMRVYKKCY